MPANGQHDPHVVVVTLPDVYAEVKSLSSSFERFLAAYDERERHRGDHEKRLQRLERKAIPVAVLLSLAGIAVSLGGLA